MSDEAGFLIDGKRYELPDMGTFTISESRVFYRETGLVPEVVRMRLADGSLTYMDLLENIGFLPALAAIAYRREHSEVDDAGLDFIIGNTPRDDLFMALLDVDEEEESPPSEGSTRPPPEQSPNGSSASTDSTKPSSESSGSPSTQSSDTPDAQPDSTGTIGSDTLRMSDPERLVT